MRSESCDIFCNVIDNYGDIGVCWRLARQMANEHGLQVRLWVDDLNSLSKLCPDANTAAEKQICRGVEVRHWTEEAFHSPAFSQTLSRLIGHPDRIASHSTKPAKGQVAGCLQLAGEGLEEREVADLVIEAFACKLPQSYIESMAVQEHEPVWINLEYLSAEKWVESHHRLPSPHPRLPLTKYFFFPGFTRQTGGLVLERDLLARRDAFQSDAAQRQAFWRSIGMEMPSTETLKISLFAYENSALQGLFDAWSSGSQPVLCVVPEGRILTQVGQYFGDAEPCAGKTYSLGDLDVRVVPFVEQERYDELLWACDVNFARGEDSCVRAQWAGKPFIWQIYPQHDAVHWDKLQAFLNLYSEQLCSAASAAVQSLWKAWNLESGARQAWPVFASAHAELERHAQYWARQLAENNLALNLLDFSREIGRMRATKIEGQ